MCRKYEQASHLCCRIVFEFQVGVGISVHAHGNLSDGHGSWPPHLHNTQGQHVSLGQTIYVNAARQNALKTNKRDIYLLH